MKGTLQELRPGVWRIRVYAGRNARGNPVQVSRTFRGGVRAAQSELAKAVAKMEERRRPPEKRTTEELLRRWLAHIEAERTPRTLDTHRQVIEHDLIPAFGKIRMDRLRADAIDEQYRIWLKTLSAATVRRKHAVLSAAFRQAVRWDWIDRSPLEQVQAPAVRRQRRTTVTIEELQALVRAAEDVHPVLATAVALASLTGCRRGELVAVRWSDIIDDAVLWVSRSITVVKKVRYEGDTKTHQERPVGLDPVALEVVRRHQDWQRHLSVEAESPLVADPWLLSHRADAGTPVNPDWLSHAFGALARSLDLPYHLHDLRHFSATTAIAEGGERVIATVAARLGHADASTTLRIYAHAVKAHDQAVAEGLGRALGTRSDNPPSALSNGNVPSEHTE